MSSTGASGQDRVINFGPGPATLPLPVLEEAQRHLLALPDIGISALEISHRSPTFAAILEEAEENLRRLLGLGEEHAVLFLHGGATLQFSMVPINLMGGASADYVVTGSWGAKAVKEASREGTVRLAWDGSGEGFRRVPEASELDLDPDASYVHVTSNETIQGVQLDEVPEVGDRPLVCDASSDFLSRPLDLDRYGLIYAGAQKNAGAAGVTLVVLRRELLERIPDGLHSMLDYRVHVAKGSTFNTPPVFAIYIVMLVSRWLRHEIGGLEAMAERNREKARLLYAAIDDSNGFYRGHAEPSSRSLMNVTWRLPTPELESEFLATAAAAGLVGLKGHRSVGGLRASIYNAIGLADVEKLTEMMRAFPNRAASG